MKTYSQLTIWQTTMQYIRDNPSVIKRWPHLIDVRPILVAVKEQLVNGSDQAITELAESTAANGINYAKELVFQQLQNKELSMAEQIIAKVASKDQIEHTDLIGITVAISAAAWYWRDRNFQEIRDVAEFVGSRCISKTNGEEFTVTMTVLGMQVPEHKYKVLAAVGSDLVWFWSDTSYQSGDVITAEVASKKCWGNSLLIKIKTILEKS